MYNKMVFLALFVSFNCTLALAECDFSTGIKQEGDGFLYNKECHLRVGTMVKNLELKDLVIQKEEERIELWRQTTYKLEEKVTSWEKWKDTNKYLYFVLGVGFTALSVHLAGSLK